MGEPSTSAPRFDGTMLKFLTHKLRTHSINEDPNHQEKADDDHDSGTESDDEFQNSGDIADEISTAMDSLEEAGGSTARDSAVPSDADLGISPPSTIGTPSQLGYAPYQLQAQPSSSSGCSSTETPPIEQPNYDFLLRLGHSDQHSSEEELEVINGPKEGETTAASASNSKTPSLRTPLPVRPSAVPEKRKWSEANSGSTSCTLMHQKSADGSETPGTAYSAPASRLGRENNSGSSDEEGACYAPPVQFRSSPPTDTHKPVRSMSPPSKLFHASFSSSCLSSAAGSSSFEQPHPHRTHHHHHHHHHHRPRSRPRPHSQYHSSSSHTSPLDHHSHHPQLLQDQQQPIAHQQQDPVDADAIGACSPRKRHRHHRHSRPCLDFEKMQQLKTQTVTTWRPTSEHGKELSVFCW